MIELFTLIGWGVLYFSLSIMIMTIIYMLLTDWHDWRE